MEPSIRPVGPGPNAPDPLRRRQAERTPFDLERELARDAQDEPREDDRPPPQREPTPVSPPGEDEAGSHLDLTA
jgi:hypothetical protein